MPIQTECPTCGNKFAAHDRHAGKIVDCPNCQSKMAVPDDGFAVPVQVDLEEYEKKRKAPLDRYDEGVPLAPLAAHTVKSQPRTEEPVSVVVVGVRISIADAIVIIIAFWGANMFFLIIAYLLYWILVGNPLVEAIEAGDPSQF